MYPEDAAAAKAKDDRKRWLRSTRRAGRKRAETTEAFEADVWRWRHRAEIAERALRQVDAANNDASPTVARIVRTALAGIADADREEK